jgi:hypothetical protein
LINKNGILKEENDFLLHRLKIIKQNPTRVLDISHTEQVKLLFERE